MRVLDRPPIVLDELSAGRIDIMVDLARWSIRRGIDILTISINYPGLNEAELSARIAHAVKEELGCPLGIDSRNPDAVEAVLSTLQPYKGLVLTVTGEQEVLDLLLPIVKRYGAVVGGMPMGRYTRHIPMTVEERLAEARFILEACEGYGIPREDLVIDCIGLAAAALEPNAMQVTLQTAQAVHEQLGLTTQVGAWNASHGLPDPRYMDLAYLLAAMSWGIDIALIEPDTPGLIECVRALDFLTGRDPVGKRYLSHWRSKQAKAKVGDIIPAEFDWSPYEKVETG